MLVWRSLRFYVVLSISIWGLILTQYWYVHSEIQFEGGGRQPVAYVFEKRNDVQRKFVDHLIWKPTTKGQPIFHGDTIRTSGDSQVDVVFTKSGASIFLNEDSQVVIDLRKGETTLNLLSGSLLAKGDIEAPTVVAGGNRIELAKKQTELVVSVNKDKELSGCVFSGAMSLQAGADANKQTYLSGNCSEKNVISTLEPRPNSVIGRLNAKGLTRFEFVGPATSYDADLYIGKKKAAMEKVASVVGQSSKGSIQTVVPEGVFFWQIAAKVSGKESARSLQLQSEMITIAPPELITPREGLALLSDKDILPVTFTWTAPKFAKQFRVEVAKDLKFSGGSIFDKLTEFSEISAPLPKNQVYYWRVIAYWKDDSLPPLSSVGRKFSIAPSTKLQAPKLIGPKDGESFALQTLKSGLTLSWTPVPDASAYSIQISGAGDKLLRFESNTSSYKWDRPLAGDLRWTVNAINAYDVSSLSNPGHLTVLSYFPVKWIKPDYTEEQSDTEKPTVRTQWTPVAGVTQWNLVYENLDSNVKGSTKFTKTTADLDLPSVGRWRLQIWGYDANGVLLAGSEKYSLNLTLAPFLQAPILEGVKGYSVSGKEDGTLDLRWNLIRGGKSYLLALKKGAGKENIVETEKLEYRYSKLPEGNYALRLMTKNSRGLAGPAGKTYKVVIPKDIGTPPPAIKSIVVH